jgi:hypothetical protein
MRTAKLFALTFTTVAAFAQTGSIDGKLIPDSVLQPPTREVTISRLIAKGNPRPSEDQIAAEQQAQVCSNVQGRIEQAAHQRELQDLGIVASPQEVAAANQAALSQIRKEQPSQISYYQTRVDLLPQAFADVFNSNPDPQQAITNELASKQVFNRELASHGVTLDEWRIDLAASMKDHGADLLARYRGFIAAASRGLAKVDMQRSVENTRLNAELDRRLALDDPQFKADLAQCQAQSANGVCGIVTAHAGEYDTWYGRIAAKCANWHQAERAKINVTLSDPSLKAKCGLQ